MGILMSLGNTDLLRASSSERYYGKTLTVTHHLKKVRALRAAKYGQASRNSCLKPQFTKHKAVAYNPHKKSVFSTRCQMTCYVVQTCFLKHTPSNKLTPPLGNYKFFLTGCHVALPPSNTHIQSSHEATTFTKMFPTIQWYQPIKLTLPPKPEVPTHVHPLDPRGQTTIPLKTRQAATLSSSLRLKFPRKIPLERLDQLDPREAATRPKPAPSMERLHRACLLYTSPSPRD